MRTTSLLLLTLALLAGCTRSSTEARREPAGATSAAAQAHGPLPFLDDDYDRALAEAKRRGVPLFVDAWAPWCHTCLSLRAYVLGDAAMAPLAGRFVWLAIDTEKAQNQSFLKKFPVEFWPTLWVIDPATEQAAVKWPGSLTVEELSGLLGDAEKAIRGKDSAGLQQALDALAEAERAAAAGKADEAIARYEALLAGPRDARRMRAVDGLVTQLWKSKQHEKCRARARAELTDDGRGTSVANVALIGLMCASKDGDAGKADAAALAARVERIARDMSQPILADDRSGLFEELVDHRKEQGDKEGARRAAADWAAFLEQQADKAPTGEARAVFDAHRMLAYLELNEHGKALAMIERSAKEFPGDYNHPARQAKVLLEGGRHDEALAAVDRSLGLAYGPRKLRIYGLKARIFEKKGEPQKARETLEQAVREGEQMHLEGKQAVPLDELRAKLAK